MFLLPCCAVQNGTENSKIATDPPPELPPDSAGKRRKEEGRKRLSVQEVQEQGLNIGIGLAAADGPPEQGLDSGSKRSPGRPSSARKSMNAGDNGKDDLMPMKKTLRRKDGKKNRKTKTK